MQNASLSFSPAARRHSFWRQPATWGAVAFYVLACAVAFKSFLLQPYPVVSSLGGDSVKNLFTYLYSAFYGGGSFHFEGMNHPFGEHLSFADAQPLLTVPVALLQKVLHLSQPQLLYLMYTAIAASFVVGMVYTQRLLQLFGLPTVWAALFSVFTLLLSPHVFRYTGHYPLAYASFLPMLVYWSVQYYHTCRKAYLGKLFLLFTAYAFLHLYFLAMALLWTVACAAGRVLLPPGQALRQRVTTAFWYLVPVAATFLLTKVFFAFTDGVTDRPELPYAGGYKQGGGLNLLTNAASPVWASLQEWGWLNHINEEAGEFCYLGIAPVAMLLLLGIATATGFWKRVSAGQPRYSGQWLFVAGCTLLFSVTVKYFWEAGIFNVLFRSLRQFRSPERFSWIAYYVLSFTAAIVLYRTLLYWWGKGRRVAASVLGTAVIALWATDVWGAVQYLKRANENAQWNARFFFSEESSWKAHLAQRGYQPQNFSALLSLPLVHIGSEKLWLSEGASYGITSAFKAALEMHLPIVDVLMSRTSWQQTFQTVRLAGGLYADQSVLRQLGTAGRPLLLSHYKEFPLNADEAALLQPGVADTLGEIDGCMLYRLWPQKVLRRQQELAATALAVARTLHSTDTVLNATLPYYVNHFEEAGGGAFAGSAGAPPVKSHDTLLATLIFPQPLALPVQYEFSAWSKFPRHNSRSNGFRLRYLNAQGGDLGVTEILGKYSTDNAAGMWFRVGAYGDVPAGTHHIEMYLQNPDGIGYEGLDEVLLRPAGATVISKMPNGKIMVNNHALGEG